MNRHDIAWQSELDRRARIYEDIEAGERWEGRLTKLDYTGLVILTVALVTFFWMWGA